MQRMSLRRTGAPLIGLLIALALVSSARAGGWSVVTLDSGGALDPASGQAIQPGVAFSFGFMVLQHGRTPMSGLTPRISATSQATGEVVNTTARAEGAVGHYVASLTLPSAGTWSWQIDAFGPVAEMAPITVAALAPAPSPAQPAPAAWPIWAALLAALAAGAGLIAVRGRAREGGKAEI